MLLAIAVAIVWYQYDLTGDPSGQGTYVETESTIPVLIQSGTILIMRQAIQFSTGIQQL